MFGIVYKIINKINSREYVGQTTQTLADRWSCHKTPKSSCTYLANAIKKYGFENFEIKILTKCDSMEEMNHREAYYIGLFKTLVPNGYNLRSGGKNSLPSEETKNKMSKAQAGRGLGTKLSKETKAKISEATKGKKNPFFGKKHNHETVVKMSMAKKGRALSSKHRGNLKIHAGENKISIKCNETGTIYGSMSQAAVDIGASLSSISIYFKGKVKSVKGFTFSKV